jgi:hypothetical protein
MKMKWLCRLIGHRWLVLVTSRLDDVSVLCICPRCMLIEDREDRDLRQRYEAAISMRPSDERA